MFECKESNLEQIQNISEIIIILSSQLQAGLENYRVKGHQKLPLEYICQTSFQTLYLPQGSSVNYFVQQINLLHLHVFLYVIHDGRGLPIYQGFPTPQTTDHYQAVVYLQLSCASGRLACVHTCTQLNLQKSRCMCASLPLVQVELHLRMCTNPLLTWPNSPLPPTNIRLPSHKGWGALLYTMLNF